MKKENLQPRLQINHILIGSYDLKDKYNFSIINSTVIKNIKVFYPLKKFSINNLKFSLFKEFSTQQNFNSNYESILKNFIITLRNNLLFRYLELLLNSFFLVKTFYIFVHKSYLSIDLIFESLLDNEIFNLITKFNISRSSLIKFFITLKFENNNKDLKDFMSYYFISF